MSTSESPTEVDIITIKTTLHLYDNPSSVGEYVWVGAGLTFCPVSNDSEIIQPTKTWLVQRNVLALAPLNKTLVSRKNITLNAYHTIQCLALRIRRIRIRMKIYLLSVDYNKIVNISACSTFQHEIIDIYMYRYR